MDSSRQAEGREWSGGDGSGVEGRGVEWRGGEGRGGEGRGGEGRAGQGRAGQGRVPDCLGGLSRVGISSRSTRPWNGQPPSMNYCCAYWGNNYKRRIQPLYMLQKKAIRICKHEGYLSHTRPIFYFVNTLRIYDTI